eukprot:3821772-Amphidinium_carterae.1
MRRQSWEQPPRNAKERTESLPRQTQGVSGSQAHLSGCHIRVYAVNTIWTQMAFQFCAQIAASTESNQPPPQTHGCPFCHVFTNSCYVMVVNIAVCVFSCA